MTDKLKTIEAHAQAEGRLCRDDGAGTCAECGVGLWADCQSCGGWGYHRVDCEEIENDIVNQETERLIAWEENQRDLHDYLGGAEYRERR